MAGIPICSYGRQAAMAEGIREKLLPEYDGMVFFFSLY